MIGERKRERIKELCRRLRPVLGTKADDIWLAYTLEDESGKAQITEYLEILASQTFPDNLQDEPLFLIPPPKSSAEGDYHLGEVVYLDEVLYPFGLREDEWIQHVGIFGRSGAGKTNLGFMVAQQLAFKGKPFVVFDWKRNYRDLLGKPGFEDMLVFTVGRNIAPLRFNPLIPPAGTDPKSWLKKVIEVIAHAYFLGEGVMYLLQKAIDTCYREFGVYEGTSKYPTLLDVLRWVRNYPAKGRESNWLSSTLRAVATLCFGEMGRLVNAGQNVGLEELLSKKVVFELDALTQSDKIFFIETLVLWIHHYRLAQGGREQFKHAIIIEEAHHILNREKRSLTGGETVMEITFREIRELGESMVVLDQHPCQISLPALGNTYCTICMNLKHRKDTNVMANCMLLEDEQKSCFGQLQLGEAVVRLQDRIRSPFVIRMPEFEVEKGAISDEAISHRMARYFKRFQSAQDALRQVSPISLADEHIEGKPNISYEESQLLIDIVRYSSSTVVARYSRLKMNRRRGNIVQKALIEAGLIRPQDVITGQGRIVLFEVTKAGRQVLQDLGHQIPDHRNGIVHRYWKKRIARQYRKQGYEVEIEKPIDGRPDITAVKGQRRIAIEIETGKSDVLGNIEADLGAGFEVVVCVATDRRALDYIRSKIEQSNIDRDRVVVVAAQRLEQDSPKAGQ